MKRALLLLLLALGCQSPAVLKPWPCDLLSERPEVDTELLEMKQTRGLILELDGHKPLVYRDTPNGAYQATREWVVEMNAKCAADREILGTKPEVSKPWYRRIF